MTSSIPAEIQSMQNEGASTEAQANRWLTYVKSDHVTEDGLNAWRDWLNQSRAHRTAYEEAELFWDSLALVPDVETVLTQPSQPATGVVVIEPQKRAPSKPLDLSYLKVLAACFVVIASGALVWLQLGSTSSTIERPSTLTYQTAAGERQVVQLSDGTELTLGGESLVTVDITEQSRHLDLIDGQVFFDVAKDKERPFVIRSDDAEITVLGTRFDLRRGVSGLAVSVVEGRVKVSREDASGQSSGTAILSAQDQIVIPNGSGFGRVTTFEAGKALAWRQGRLYFDDVSLEEILVDVNRHTHVQLALSDDTLKDLRVSAAFAIDQTDEMLEALTLSFPIQIERSGGVTIIKPS